ncbi:MAG: hypothetical protein LAO51_10540 [Acidobacteriia bacterium]|nr:hypothetical protein [Terriglobia bacterium]
MVTTKKTTARRANGNAVKRSTLICADPDSPHNGHGIEIRIDSRPFAYCRCTRCVNPERFYLRRDLIIEQV